MDTYRPPIAGISTDVESLRNGLRMIATLGHSCGLVDPHRHSPQRHPGPLASILNRLAETTPALREDRWFAEAVARVTDGT